MIFKEIENFNDFYFNAMMLFNGAEHSNNVQENQFSTLVFKLSSISYFLFPEFRKFTMFIHDKNPYRNITIKHFINMKEELTQLINVSFTDNFDDNI